MAIHDAFDLNAAAACRDLKRRGFTFVDDFQGNLIDDVEYEILDGFGFAGDDLDLVVEELDTQVGTLFVFLLPGKASLEKARAYLRKHHPML